MRCLLTAATLLAVAGLWAPPALAEDCTDATQMGLDECAGAAYKKADAELNQIYGRIVARLAKDASTKAKLVTAQKAWITFRDTECAFRASAVEGGSMYPMAMALCLADATKQRVAELRPLLSCQEGDTTCPVPSSP
ncbi:lysozyme inhibitor LprI family protein [Ancylobacter sp. WKF20]|uniref:lysozyme inhibitor LprI family protein n=1 Tax=Ancylobacter sp. WKF20 TaxID=3039801 RepID=UPI0024344D93|nr:lysozyme inhibitor LprI family protein [Ancylobacter sp. WKF20]WGD31500.1 lysozyme inhibitor LprI family protein [Ancylobacter sp. WKF20]